MKFKNGDLAKIVNTTDANIDEVMVIVSGVSYVNMADQQAFYVIEKASGDPFITSTGALEVDRAN